MANIINAPPATGTKHFTFDTDATPEVGEPGFLGNASPNKIGSFMVQVAGSTWTGELVPQGQLPGATAASIGWIALAYQDLNTAADVAGGTAITADGIYAIRADHGMLVRLAYTHTAGTVDVVVTEGVG